MTTLRNSFLSVLPVQSVVYCHGGRVGFFQGDIRLLSDDMKALCPTIFPVVPRLLNRMYDKVSLAGSLCLFRQRLEPPGRLSTPPTPGPESHLFSYILTLTLASPVFFLLSKTLVGRF